MVNVYIFWNGYQWEFFGSWAEFVVNVYLGNCSQKVHN